MLKTNIGIKERFIISAACFIATSVLMLSVHAKDIVHYTDTTVASQVGFHDISAKAARELHDHVDKQVVKTFDKGVSSDTVVMSTRNRNDIDSLTEDDPGLWGRLHETFLIWRVFASLPFAIS